MYTVQSVAPTPSSKAQVTVPLQVKERGGAEAESKEIMVYGTQCRSSPHLLSTPESTPTYLHGQPYARVDFIPQSGTSDLASGGSTIVKNMKFSLRRGLEPGRHDLQ